MYNFFQKILFFLFFLLLKRDIKILDSERFLVFQFSHLQIFQKNLIHNLRNYSKGFLLHIASNWEVKKSSGWCFCYYLYSITFVIQSLLHLGKEEFSLGNPALPPEDLLTLPVAWSSAGDQRESTINAKALSSQRHHQREGTIRQYHPSMWK